MQSELPLWQVSSNWFIQALIIQFIPSAAGGHITVSGEMGGGGQLAVISQNYTWWRGEGGWG